MNKCLHQNSPEKDWLPASNGIMKLHPFCHKCGVVRNISSDHGREVGYFINSLSELRNHMERKGYKISKAQMRLIIREFEEKGLDDVYSVTFSKQREGFAEIVREYTGVSEDLVKGFL